MTVNTKTRQEETQKSWGSDDILATIHDVAPDRPEQIVMRIAEETAEKFRAIFAAPSTQEA